VSILIRFCRLDCDRHQGVSPL